MPLRKAHTKSRFGCLPCKRRHIKCDEEVPSCQNCVFRKVTCEYGLAARASIGILARAASSDGAISTASPPCSESQQLLTTTFAHEPVPSLEIRASRLQELQLMICYMNKTSQTLAHDDEDLVIWREAIPEEAVHHDFLMDGLLAMSALHFAYEKPDTRLQYTELAMRYQNSGLQIYNKALENINEENCTALFAFSILVNVMAIALPNTIPNSAPSSYTESIMTMLELIRGIGLIHSSAISTHRTGKLASFYRALPPNLEPDDETMAALERLSHRANTLLASESIDEKRHGVYLSAVQSLEVAFGCMKVSNHLGRIIGWPASLRSPGHCEELMRLFKYGDVMTQLIFMHYGVLLLHTQHRWWGRRTGVSLIEDLAVSVRAAGPDWVVATKWPLEVAKSSVGKDVSGSAQQES